MIKKAPHLSMKGYNKGGSFDRIKKLDFFPVNSHSIQHFTNTNFINQS